jgi:hypothetical protein
MKYMLLLHNRSEEDSKTPLYASFEEEMAAHDAFSDMVRAQNRLVSAEALHEAPEARTLRPGGNGEVLVSDGPFADVKEQIGGYYVIEADSIDHAVELARSCPLYAGIEVRPVMEFPDA